MKSELPSGAHAGSRGRWSNPAATSPQPPLPGRCKSHLLWRGESSFVADGWSGKQSLSVCLAKRFDDADFLNELTQQDEPYGTRFSRKSKALWGRQSHSYMLYFKHLE